MNKVTIIGSGFSGLSTAAFLSKEGYDVLVIEKNKEYGGRARNFKENNYSFDMGPSWYWMPDIFDNFFSNFNHKISDLYNLTQLDPGFKMIFKEDEIPIYADWKKTCEVFEKYENQGSNKLKKFIEDANKKYNIGLHFLYNSPGLSLLELFNKMIILNINKLQLTTSYKQHVRKYFSHPYLISILEFPVLFLGSAPKDTPALYSLMAYSGIKQGTFYPQGGMINIINAMIKICKDQGVVFMSNTQVKKINVIKNSACSLTLEDNKIIKSDIIIGSADYAHVESLLDKQYRNYSNEYWEKKVLSPSSLIFYLGVKRKINKFIHHNLFFNEDIEKHTNDIYLHKKWPKKPLFYVCCPSKTDPTVAPANKENIFILIPIASGLNDNLELREKYFNYTIDKLEKYCNQDIKNNIEFKRSYCIQDFEKDYNALKGNAFGLANTLMQTANLKPKIINKKVNNLYYTGQLTVPGPGVPPAIISGELVAKHILEKNKKRN